jgi:MbtH protein
MKEIEMSDTPQTPVYRVVIDRENQYSIWTLGKALPTGWTEAGKSGTEKECLDFIAENAPVYKYAKSKESQKNRFSGICRDLVHGLHGLHGFDGIERVFSQKIRVLSA